MDKNSEHRPMNRWSWHMYESIRQQELRVSAACSARLDVLCSSWVIRRNFSKFDILLQWLKSRKSSDVPILSRMIDDSARLQSINALFTSDQRIENRPTRWNFWVYLCFFCNFSISPLSKRYKRS
jgi:hypothetical protein